MSDTKRHRLRDIDVSEIGMGCRGQIPDVQYSAEAIQNAFHHGCTLFDTAEALPDNEMMTETCSLHGVVQIRTALFHFALNEVNPENSFQLPICCRRRMHPGYIFLSYLADVDYRSEIVYNNEVTAKKSLDLKGLLKNNARISFNVVI